ncbi:MAG: hypothetical protein L3J83_08905 [Proteobacteria bacterium]|nr:hypothetical protein [Pseudomonadota bacterium]
MDIVISGNNTFCKWLGLDLPRVESTDGKGIGVQKLITGLARVSWQCHAIKRDGMSDDVRDIILVESYSRYTIIIPNLKPMCQYEFEDILLKQWANELLEILQEHHVIIGDEVTSMVVKFQMTDFKFHWIQNTDMSVNGHVSDAEMWLRSDEDQYYHKAMSEDQAYSLGRHINQFRKKATLSQKPKRFDHFYPIERFCNDFMLRFSNREFSCPYPMVYLGEFPNPYQYAQSKAEMIKRNKHKHKQKAVKTDKIKPNGSANIISIDFARMKKK